MSLKRECDRCGHLTPVDSLSGRDYRMVKIERGATASTNGGATTLNDAWDLCDRCTRGCRAWLNEAPSREVAK